MYNFTSPWPRIVYICVFNWLSAGITGFECQIHKTSVSFGDERPGALQKSSLLLSYYVSYGFTMLESLVVRVNFTKHQFPSEMRGLGCYKGHQFVIVLCFQWIRSAGVTGCEGQLHETSVSFGDERPGVLQKSSFCYRIMFPMVSQCWSHWLWGSTSRNISFLRRREAWGVTQVVILWSYRILVDFHRNKSTFCCKYQHKWNPCLPSHVNNSKNDTYTHQVL